MPRHNGARSAQQPQRRKAPRFGARGAATPQTATSRFRPLESPSRRLLRPGAVVFAHVPFDENDQAYKSRPALVVALRGDDLVEVRPITGSRNYQVNATPITDWAAAGLKKPSVVRAKSITLDRRLELTGYLGQLSERDLAAVFRLAATS